MATVAAPRKQRNVKAPHGTCRLTLCINGTHYSLRPVPCDPGSGALRCWSLRKTEDREVYHVSQHSHGCQCTCPSWVFDHDGHNAHPDCKHIAALSAVGLL